MLYQLGPISMDTTPFNVDEVTREGSASLAVKAVMGSLPQREFMGEGDDKLKLTGKLMPLHVGGLTELEMARGFMTKGERLPVLRGDGKMMGWFAIESISEGHKNLYRDGVGMTASYNIAMVRTQPGGAGMVNMLLTLFEAL